MTSRVFVVRRSPLARPLTAVVAAVLVTSALVGCTGASFAGACEPVFEPGDASNAVTATGDVGDSPAVEFPTPLIAEETQRSVLVQGDGEPAAAGSVIRARYTYFDGATGASGTESTELFTASDLAKGLGESLECVTVGSRIAVVGPVAEVLDGVDEGTEGTIVAVLDIEAIYLGKANGVNQLPQDGMPTVVTAVNGEPGISSTYQPIAEEPRTATIKAGSGATVADGDTVVFHARSWNWSAGTTSTVTLGDVDSWTSTPYALAPSAESLGDETLVDAFIGATVGSQILIVIPAEDSASSATVYVFDILGILATE
jgi:peptidylprolyl isomerase